MANTKITADNLAANAVTSASIADNSIGITQLNVSDGTNGQVLTTNGSGTLSFSTISGYTDSDVESYLNTSTIYTDATNDRLGIGTSSPSYTLDVQGSATDYEGLRVLNTNSAASSTTSAILLGVTNSVRNVYSKIQTIEDGTDANETNLAFFTTNPSATLTEAFRIDENQNIGIGETTPVAKLHIQGTGTSGQVTSSFLLENASSGTAGMDITGAAGSSRLRFLYGGGPSTGTNTLTEALNIVLEGSNAGNVGIGTTSPEGQLEIGSSAEAVAFVTGNGSCLRLLAYDVDPSCWIQSGTGKTASQLPLYISGMFGTNITATFDTANQRVGIGTTSPTETLHVNSRAKIGNITLAGNSTDSTLSAGNANFKISTLTHTGGATDLDFDVNIVVTGVGIANRFKVDSPTGDTYTNDGTISSLSDIRVKTDIQDLTDGLEIVKQLRPVTFKYNDDSTDDDGNSMLAAADDKIRYGFIAQEVEAVAPHYVETSTRKINNEEVDDFKSLSTTRMIPMLFKAIQEQQTIIDDLKARIETLENA